MLYTWNYHDIVNQLYFNKKKKEFEVIALYIFVLKNVGRQFSMGLSHFIWFASRDIKCLFVLDYLFKEVCSKIAL